jgi:2-dehydro-3-deoxygluconokinase
VDAAHVAIEGARWIHLTGITPALSPSAAAAVVRAKELARGAGVQVSLDLNIRRRLWSEAEAAVALRALVDGCDLVLGGLEEAALVGGMAASLEEGSRAAAEEAADALLAAGAGRAIVKLGADGALLRDRDGTSVRSAALPVPRVVDPVGAGDAFTAGYLALTLEGAPMELALRAANACGALAVSTVGDLTGLPDRSTLDALLAGAGGPDTIR